MISGLRSTKQARIGDTIYIPSQWSSTNPVTPLDGYAPAKQMLYMSVYPLQTADTELLVSSVDRLCLNDNSVSVSRDQSTSLGSGLRCGFLGFLHMEVFMQRLKNEFEMEVVTTSPSVPYILLQTDGTSKKILSIEEFPNQDKMKDTKVSVFAKILLFH
jgi:translation elongation factor EF-4